MRGMPSPKSRSAVVALLLASTTVVASKSADASLAIAASVADLTRTASAVAVITPLAQTSEWQSKRIITLTRVRVEHVVAGRVTASEVMVRSLGGSVGGISQYVEGEPAFALNRNFLVFLRELPNGLVAVNGRAQGQFQVAPRTNDATPRVYRSRDLGELVWRRTTRDSSTMAAVIALHESALSTAEAQIQRAWESTHAR